MIAKSNLGNIQRRHLRIIINHPW